MRYVWGKYELPAAQCLAHSEHPGCCRGAGGMVFWDVWLLGATELSSHRANIHTYVMTPDSAFDTTLHAREIKSYFEIN